MTGMVHTLNACSPWPGKGAVRFSERMVDADYLTPRKALLCLFICLFLPPDRRLLSSRAWLCFSRVPRTIYLPLFPVGDVEELIGEKQDWKINKLIRPRG